MAAAVESGDAEEMKVHAQDKYLAFFRNIKSMETPKVTIVNTVARSIPGTYFCSYNQIFCLRAKELDCQIWKGIFLYTQEARDIFIAYLFFVFSFSSYSELPVV